MATGNGNGNGNGNGQANGKAAVAELLRTRTLRVAVVGCGYWGPKVIRAAASLPEVEIAALVDRDLDLAAKRAAALTGRPDGHRRSPRRSRTRRSTP